jgi:hypothetical protein
MHIQRVVCFKNTAVSQLIFLSLLLSLSLMHFSPLFIQCEACWAIGGTDGRYGSCLNADGEVATQARPRNHIFFCRFLEQIFLFSREQIFYSE